jgi:RND family efflux transporter MFP subunit
VQKKTLVIAAVAFAGLVLAAAWVLSPTASVEPVTSAADGTETAVAALTVEATRPEIETWPVEVPASGWLAPWAEAVVASEVGGERIVAVNVEIGDEVRTGDVLAELSRLTAENRIAELEAALESAQAALESASEDAGRAQKLTSGGSISKQEIAGYLVTERKAKAAVKVAEAQLATVRLTLENTKIVAVGDGVISSVSAALGQVVSEGEELFRLIRDNRIEWQAEVPIMHLRGIEVGTRASIPTPLGEVAGTVRRISPAASQSNGRVITYVDLQPPEGVPMPKTGILVSGSLIVGETEAITLPASAVTMQDGFSYVFVIKDDAGTATVAKERVETGRRRGDRVEIAGDLPTEAQVALSGGAFLSDGSVVRVVGSDAAAQEDSE